MFTLRNFAVPLHVSFVLLTMLFLCGMEEINAPPRSFLHAVRI